MKVVELFQLSPAAYSNTESGEKQPGFCGVLVVCNGLSISLLDKSISNQAIDNQPFVRIQIFGPFHALPTVRFTSYPTP